MIPDLLLEGINDHRTVDVVFKQSAVEFIEAEDYVDMFGVHKQTTAGDGGGENVGFIHEGDWMDYTFYVAEAGDYFVGFRVASPTANIAIDLK